MHLVDIGIVLNNGPETVFGEKMNFRVYKTYRLYDRTV